MTSLFKIIELLIKADAVLASRLKKKTKGPAWVAFKRWRKVVLSQEALYGVLLLIFASVKELPTKMAGIDRRLALVELRLGVAGNVTDQAVTAPGPVTPAASRSAAGLQPAETNQFTFLHK